jgi:hypothetical protein
MIVRKIILLGVVGAAALVGAALIAAAPAEARCEREAYTGRATGLLRALTGVAARSDWRSEVRRYAGPDYAYWSRAKSRVTYCRKVNTRWSCRARAIPCNS